jgi:hypothetical protein
MLPKELFNPKKRHASTPESVMVIFVNYIVMAVAVQAFALCDKINWFFWVIIAGLAAYNFFSIRRNYEQYNKPAIIAYTISLAGIIALLLFFRLRPHNC